MASPRLLAYADRVKRQHWHGKGYVPSKNAPHHPDDLVFRRTQSAAMAARQWEHEPIWQSWAAGFCCVVFIAATLILALAL